jgi:hypothetical protein
VAFAVWKDMTDTSSKRDPRYTRTVGKKPNQGRRYVDNGKVRIEWYEDGKRHKRTIGENSAAARREADDELKRLLGLVGAEPGASEDFAEEFDEECLVLDISWLVEEFRSRADALMDVADDLAESFEKGLVNVLSVFKRSDEADDVEDAEIVDESEDAEEPEEAE